MKGSKLNNNIHAPMNSFIHRFLSKIQTTKNIMIHFRFIVLVVLYSMMPITANSSEIDRSSEIIKMIKNDPNAAQLMAFSLPSSIWTTNNVEALGIFNACKKDNPEIFLAWKNLMEKIQKYDTINKSKYIGFIPYGSKFPFSIYEYACFHYFDAFKKTETSRNKFIQPSDSVIERRFDSKQLTILAQCLIKMKNYFDFASFIESEKEYFLEKSFSSIYLSIKFSIKHLSYSHYLRMNIVELLFSNNEVKKSFRSELIVANNDLIYQKMIKDINDHGGSVDRYYYQLNKMRNDVESCIPKIEEILFFEIALFEDVIIDN